MVNVPTRYERKVKLPLPKMRAGESERSDVTLQFSEQGARCGSNVSTSLTSGQSSTRFTNRGSTTSVIQAFGFKRRNSCRKGHINTQIANHVEPHDKNAACILNGDIRSPGLTPPYRSGPARALVPFGEVIHPVLRPIMRTARWPADLNVPFKLSPPANPERLPKKVQFDLFLSIQRAM